MTKEEFIAATPAAAQKYLDGLSMPQLVAYHNQLTGAHMKKFADRPDGIKRIWRWRKVEVELAAKAKPVEEPVAPPKKAKILGTHKEGGVILASQPPEPAESQEPHGGEATDTQEGPQSAPPAAAETPGANGAGEEIPGKPVQEESVATKPQAAEEIQVLTNAAAKPAVNGRAKGSDERKVKLLKNINPKRAGSAAFDRFELYQDGMTVKEALTAGVRREDIKWDTDHKLIELVEEGVAH